MPIALLTLLKLVLLLLLYLFVFRAVRVLVADLFGSPRRTPPPARPPVATASPPRRSRKMPREIVVHPPDARPQVLRLSQDRVVLGRADHVSVRLEDAYVSDEHAEVLPENGGWMIRDLGSTNGTFLNGAKVTQPTPLSSGDQVRLGKTRVEVRR